MKRWKDLALEEKIILLLGASDKPVEEKKLEILLWLCDNVWFKDW